MSSSLSKKIYKMLEKKGVPTSSIFSHWHSHLNYQSKKLTSALCTENSDLFADRIEGTNRTDI